MTQNRQVAKDRRHRRVRKKVRGTAARLADDLEHFLGSFATVPVSLGGGMRLVLPPDVAQRWKRRVDAKTLHDANWLFRGKS